MMSKLLDLVLKKPIDFVNEKTSGYKVYLASFVIILPAISCLISDLLAAPLSVDRILQIAGGSCIKQLGEGLAVWGFRAAIKK